MPWTRLLLAITSPLLFFAIAEAVLWTIGVPTLLEERDPFLGFSQESRVFEPTPDGNYWETPPRATRQTFNPQRFLREKPDNGYRLFVLGGSSAYGFPWDARTAFPRSLGDVLAAAWPERQVGSHQRRGHVLRISPPSHPDARVTRLRAGSPDHLRRPQ